MPSSSGYKLALVVHRNGFKAHWGYGALSMPGLMPTGES